jgi:hypothetical protein
MLNNSTFKTISKIFLAVFVVFMASNLKAQQYNTIYWMQGIPQHVYSNPAHQTDANWYIGMPGLSSIYAGYGNSGFGISDLLKKDANGEFYWDEASFLEGLGRKNILYTDMQYEALAFGFRYKEKNYFNFNFSEKVGVQFGYPKDLFLLLLEGNNHFLENTDTGEADFSGFGINAIHYSEFGLGYSRILNDMFNVGGKIKVLFGHANAYMSPNDLRFHTDPETFALSLYTDVSVHTSLPMEIGPISLTDDGEENNESGNDFEFDPMEYLVNFNNLGFAADLGIIYKYDEKITFALSVVDLGYINWKSNVESYRITGDAVYDGIDIGNLFALGGFVELPEDEEEQGDPFETALENLEIDYSQKSYSLFLYPKIFVSAKYQVTDIHSFSVLARGNFFENKLYPSFTLAYNIQPIKPVGLTLAYSVINYTYTNIGLGFHLNLYPFQLYLVADNIFPALQPHTIQTATVHIGINWVFGYRGKSDPSKPMCGWSF